MKFSLFVNAAPAKNIAHSTALLTARAILASDQHDLYRVFFYSEGVRHGIGGRNNPWQALASGTSTDLCFCSGSTQKYKASLPDHPNVSIGGLVQLLDAQLNSDRIVSLS